MQSDAKSSSVGSNTVVSWVDGGEGSAFDHLIDSLMDGADGGGGAAAGARKSKSRGSGSRSNNSSGSNWTADSNRTTSTNKSGTVSRSLFRRGAVLTDCLHSSSHSQKRFVNKQPQPNRRSINNHYKDPHFQPAVSLDEARHELSALTETNLRKLSNASSTSSTDVLVPAKTVHNSRSNNPPHSAPAPQIDFSFPTEYAPHQQYRCAAIL